MSMNERDLFATHTLVHIYREIYNLNTRTSREEQCINSTRPVFETFHKTGIGTLLVDEDGKYE